MPDDPPNNINQDQKILLNTIGNIIKFQNLLPETVSKDFKFNNINDLIKIWENTFLQLFKKNPLIKVETLDQKKFLWVGIHCSDDMYGIWGLFRKNQSQYIFPLTEIKEVVENFEISTSLQKYNELTKIILPN
jgi:hypothetical protein